MSGRILLFACVSAMLIMGCSVVAEDCDADVTLISMGASTEDELQTMSVEHKRSILIRELSTRFGTAAEELEKEDMCQLISTYDSHVSAENRVFRQTKIPVSDRKRMLKFHEVVRNWEDDLMDLHVRAGTLVSVDGARIDNQSGPITRNGHVYYNLQAQMGSETYATVMLPAGIKYGKTKIRNAFITSQTNNQLVELPVTPTQGDLGSDGEGDDCDDE